VRRADSGLVPGDQGSPVRDGICQGWNSDPCDSSAATSCRTLHLHHGIGNVSHMAQSLGRSHIQLATDLGYIHATPVLQGVGGRNSYRRSRGRHGKRVRQKGPMWDPALGEERTPGHGPVAAIPLSDLDPRACHVPCRSIHSRKPLMKVVPDSRGFCCNVMSRAVFSPPV